MSLSRPMTIAVASGKGGTGKTTVALNMALVLGGPVQLLDCDVEEPNAHLFLRLEGEREEPVCIPTPVIDESLCDACGECGRFCEYHAIVSFGAKPLVFPELCHGCGGCAAVCPKGAIGETGRRIGVVGTARSGEIELVQGRLDVGTALAPPLIRAVKRRLRSDLPAIVDAPPGTSCPVIAAVRDADAVVLVTEPTPFGLNDLALAVATVRELQIPFGVVVNRAGSGDEGVHAFCAREGIPMLLEIPDDRRIAEAYSMGKPIAEALPAYRGLFRGLIDTAARLAGIGARADGEVRR